MTHLRRLLDYDVWANRRDPGIARGRVRLPHEASSGWPTSSAPNALWLARLRREASPLPVWPDAVGAGVRCSGWVSSPGSGRRFWTHIRDRWISRFPTPTRKGEAWTNTVEEILTHVTVHSAYHRGQIASDLRAAGMTPAYTDYIHAVRQGLI